MNINRRRFLEASAAVGALASLETRLTAEERASGGTLNHSVCKWCYGQISLDELCAEGKKFGLQSVELLEPKQIDTVKKHGMTCALMSFPVAERADGTKVGTITHAWNALENHDVLVSAYEQRIKECADLGIGNLICFSGNRHGLSDDEGLHHCAVGLKRILPTAEKHGITISMELLNSKVDHKDYMCDHTAWGAELCEAIQSDKFKLLYDIYHMQIMEGDVIATIRDNHKYFSHYHTGGVPGRHEIDETQELNYPAIVRAIQDTGYSGFIGQEFLPKRDDKLASLKQGVDICSV